MSVGTRDFRHSVFALAAAFVFFIGLVSSAEATLAAGDCVDFEDEIVGSQVVKGGTLSDSGVVMTGVDFRDSNGDIVQQGSVFVRNSQQAGGTGKDVQFANLSLDFDFGGAVTDVGFLFRDYGGNVNLTVNGDFRNTADLSDLDGLTVGGALVSVLVGPTGFGYVLIVGTVNEFIIGGQELYIDDVCDAGPPADCIDFDDLPNATTYTYGHWFVDNNVPVLVEDFTLTGGGTTTGSGATTHDTGQMAGGSNGDIDTNNVTLLPEFGGSYQNVSMYVGIYGGNMNLIVNGVLANTTDITSLANTKLGLATVTLQTVNANKYRLFVAGNVRSIQIGGQEFYIDDLCVSNRLPAEIFADGFESNGTGNWSITVGGP